VREHLDAWALMEELGFDGTRFSAEVLPDLRGHNVAKVAIA
jgi:hypothetical protein